MSKTHNTVSVQCGWRIVVALLLLASGQPVHVVAQANNATYLPLVAKNSSGVRLPNPLLLNLPDNTALDLGKYTTDQLTTTCETYPIRITDYSRFTYDPVHHQMLMFGGGHATTPRTDVDVFNPNTLTWGSAYNSTPVSEMVESNLDRVNGFWISTGHPPADHTYDLLPFAPNTGELILMSPGYIGAYCIQLANEYLGGKVRHYNPVTKTWRASRVQMSVFDDLGSAEYDPPSGLIVFVSRAGLWTYDPVGEVAAQRLVMPGTIAANLGYDHNLIYFPPNQKHYLINRATPTQVFEFTLNRNNWSASAVVEVTGMSNVPNGFDGVATGFAYDSVNRMIGGGVSSGVFYAYDPLTKVWTAKVMLTQPAGLTVGTVAFHALDYDPINNVFIFLGNQTDAHTWAYRYKR